MTALLPPHGADYAAALAAPPLTNLHRIGDEMFAWSDRDPARSPALPRGAVLRYLLSGLTESGSRVLVAGPHADEVVTALSDAGASVTWLLRSLRDAELVAEQHPTVTVVAGAATKFDPADRYDLVVAADGVDRLNSAEGGRLSGDELLDLLAGSVRPGGALLLMHDNHLGPQHTLRLEPGARFAKDSAWDADLETRRPASRQQLVAQLTAAGLVLESSYAAFPEPHAPTVLIGEGLVGDVTSPLRPRLGTALAQAYAAAFRNRPVLSDPRELIERALRAGAEDAMAAGWLVIMRNSEAPPARGDDARLLLGDLHGTFTYEVTDAGTTVLQPLEHPVERAGLRRIELPAVPGANQGYVLEERLLDLCAAGDLRGVRRELAAFDRWLVSQAADGRLSGPVAVAGLADIFVIADGPALLPTRWEPIEPVALETSLVRTVWEFAVLLITSGRPHPWPITMSAVDLTSALLGMLDRAVDEAAVRQAVALHLALETAEQELTPAEQHDRELALLAVQPGTAPVDVAGYRELAEALWRQRYQASHLLAMMEWTERMIKSRDLALSKMDWELQFYRKRLAGRMVMAARAARKRILK
jgi:hypothetical protein